MASLAVITCHFNWAGFDRPVQNLRRFCRQMTRDGIPVYGVELHLAGREPAMRGVKGWRTLQCDERAILWQKEALLNLAETAVPKNVRFLAALDADIAFDRSDWATATIEALRAGPVVQPYGRALWSGRRGEEILQRPSAAAAGLTFRPWTGHPGFAWAFRRDFFRAVGGFYDLAALGAGDVAWAYALLHGQQAGEDWDHLLSHLGPANEGLYRKWMKKVRRVLGDARVGSVEGDLWHEWHGSREDRRYAARPAWIEGYDAAAQLERHPLGYWTWRKDAPRAVRARFHEYFLARREDG